MRTLDLNNFDFFQSDLVSTDLNAIQIEIQNNPGLNLARVKLDEQLHEDGIDLQCNMLAANLASQYLEEAFKALDEIIKIPCTYTEYRPKKNEEKLGTRNKFKYFASLAYLNTKKAIFETEKYYENSTKRRLKEIAAGLEEFIMEKMYNFFVSKRLMNLISQDRVRMAERISKEEINA